MKLVSLTICRNSGWCIEAVLRSALDWCDECIVFNHASTDDTGQVLERLAEETGKIHVIDEPDPVWYEQQHRQRTLDKARELGATHCAIIDDDEILCAHLTTRVREMVSALKPCEVLSVPWITLWKSLDQYRVDGKRWTTAYKSLAFKDSPELYWKAENGYEHHHTAPYNGVEVRRLPFSDGGLLHFQHASWHRLVLKQTWYMCMEAYRYGSVQADYKGTMDDTGAVVSLVPCEWWNGHKGKILLRSRPWQLDDLASMVADKGLDFFQQHGIDVGSVISFWERNGSF